MWATRDGRRRDPTSHPRVMACLAEWAAAPGFPMGKTSQLAVVLRIMEQNPAMPWCHAMCFFPAQTRTKKTCFRTWFRKQGKSHLWRSNLFVSALFVYLRSKASAIYVQLSERRAGMTLTIFVTCGAPQLFFVGLQAHLTKHRSRNYHHWKNNRLPKAHGNPILVGGDWNMTFMTFIDFPYIGNNHPK